MNIFVSSLSFKTNNDELKHMFEAYGEVTSARIITDRDTRRSKGYGFVEMPNDNEGNAAINALNGSEQGGRTINVSVARERVQRSY